jgi:hypothetical protein
MIAPQFGAPFRGVPNRHQGLRFACGALWPFFETFFSNTMKHSLLIASLVAAFALTACGKKEEAPAPAPAPAAEPAPAPAAPAADAAAAPAAAPAADAAAAPAAPAADAAAAPAAAPAAPAAEEKKQ